MKLTETVTKFGVIFEGLVFEVASKVSAVM
jgi:hypothetical protein